MRLCQHERVELFQSSLFRLPSQLFRILQAIICEIISAIFLVAIMNSFEFANDVLGSEYFFTFPGIKIYRFCKIMPGLFQNPEKYPGSFANIIFVKLICWIMVNCISSRNFSPASPSHSFGEASLFSASSRAL